MDVSNRAPNGEALSVVTGSDTPQGGPELLAALVALTGLPEPLVQEELVGILESAGHSPATLTLDQLRSAMMAYLESMQGELLGVEEN